MSFSASKAFAAALASISLAALGVSASGADQLLNVSYDPTRELYADYNAAFAKQWQAKTGKLPSIQQSHGGSGKQARAVIDGLEADVVTLALASDIDAIASKAKLLPEDWQKRLPNNSSPYASTIIFVVRKGNPKGIKDWDDLVKPGVSVITPNPKTSGGARWNYLAAWGYALKKELGDLNKIKSGSVSEADQKKADAKAKEFIGAIFKNVPVLDSGARGSTITFAQRELGDVLLAWENEAFLIGKEFGEGKYEIVVPKLSILAEPPVALVDKNVERHKTKELAQAYLEYLYSPEGQEIAARNFYRPSLASVAEKYKDKFPSLELFSIDDVLGGWSKVQNAHFGDNGVFDQIYKPAAK